MQEAGERAGLALSYFRVGNQGEIMAVSTSYSFGFLESIDPFSLTGNADAASLAGGGVVVSGDHIGHTDATLFNADGDIVGSAAVISGTESAVSQLSNGNVVVATDNGNVASFTILNSTGGVVTGPTDSDVTFNQLLDVDVAGGVGGGRFVVASQAFFAGTDNDIRINIRNNDGSAVTSFSVDTSGANDQNPSVAALNDGAFVVAWHRNVGSNNEMWYAVYNADGSQRLAPTLLDSIGTVNRNASVVALDNGGFAIAYEDNGWNGDIDITLARFTAAGTFVDWDDITQNASNDTAPSATVLSNGMIAVGYTNDVFGDTDTRITLVDQNTGAALATSTVGGSLGNELQMSIAGMSNGQLGAFYTLSGDVVGSVRQATRVSTGDAANDTILGDDLQDIVSGGAGDDTVQGGLNADILNGDAGNDTFQFEAGETFGDTIDGGADFDRVLALGNANLANAIVTSIEEIEFANTTIVAKSINVDASQIGAGLAANLLVDGNQSGVADTLRIVMGTDTNVNLSAFTFQNWDSGPAENDRILVIGDGDAEIITGSSQRDDIFGNGGNDRLGGGGGVDVLRGGDGNDRYVVNAAGEAIEGFGQGTDEVRSNVNYTLGANIERLVLSGAAVAGKGNTLNNSITGNTGNNLLDGLGGNDTLTGGAGVDRFQFTTALNAATNVDIITDFQVGVDEIRLDNAVFTGLPLGPLNPNRFEAGPAADPSDRILYNATTGVLFYDPDGNPAGPGSGAAPIRFAVLDPGLALTASDFFVV